MEVWIKYRDRNLLGCANGSSMIDLDSGGEAQEEEEHGKEHWHK